MNLRFWPVVTSSVTKVFMCICWSVSEVVKTYLEYCPYIYVWLADGKKKSFLIIKWSERYSWSSHMFAHINIGYHLRSSSLAYISCTTITFPDHSVFFEHYLLLAVPPLSSATTGSDILKQSRNAAVELLYHSNKPWTALLKFASRF